MFRRVAHLGVVVMGLALVACWGCGERAPKDDSGGKKAGQEVKGGGPEAEERKPDQTETPEAPVDQTGPGQQPPETPDPAEADASSGRSGRAVGKVFKRLMQE